MAGGTIITEFTSNQFFSLCQTGTTDQSIKIQKSISFNLLNGERFNICNTGIEYEKGLKLCSRIIIRIQENI